MFYIDRRNICTEVVFNILISRDELTKHYYNHFIISHIFSISVKQRNIMTEEELEKEIYS